MAGGGRADAHPSDLVILQTCNQACKLLGMPRPDDPEADNNTLAGNTARMLCFRPADLRSLLQWHHTCRVTYSTRRNACSIKTSLSGYYHELI